MPNKTVEPTRYRARLTIDDMQKIKITLVAILMAVVCGCASTEKGILLHPDRPEYSIDLSSPDITKDLEEGKLKIWYIAKGTRSEGLHGEIEGMNISPEKGMKLQTKAGTLVYAGSWNERTQLFSMSGWLPTDLKDIGMTQGHTGFSPSFYCPG